MNQNFHEWVFFRTVCELAKRVQSDDDYEIITSAALIRHLLIDGEPLVHKAQKRLQLKPRFTIYKVPNVIWSGEFAPNVNSVFAYQNIGQGPQNWKTEVDLEGLLATEVAKLGGTRFSVRMVVKFVASVLGGVHTFRPSGESEKLLVSMQESVFLGDTSAVMVCIKNIALVVSRSLLSLAVELHGDQEVKEQASSLLEELLSKYPPA